MARLSGSKDGDNIRRDYNKQDAEYWERPTLADLIRDNADLPYDELRDLVLSSGYARTSFYQTMSELRSEADYNGDDGL